MAANEKLSDFHLSGWTPTTEEQLERKDAEDEDGTLEDAMDVEERSQDKMVEVVYSHHIYCGMKLATWRMDCDPFRREGGVKLSEILIANLHNYSPNILNLYLICHSLN